MDGEGYMAEILAKREECDAGASPNLPKQPSPGASRAVISECGLYRYSLSRDLGGHSPFAVFIMLNPSTADAEQDDPTIRRCMGFAKSWGCGKLFVLNLFAIRATDPKNMLAADDPEGPENWEHFRRRFDLGAHEDPLTRDKDVIVCAWGAHGTHRNQDRTVMGWFDRWGITPKCLGTTKSGQPKHPLYLPSNAALTPYKGRR